MAGSWLSIRVELVAGRGEFYWPRPGRLFVAHRDSSFRELADAINVAFARWELAHLHRFALADGSEVAPLEWWDDAPDGALDDAGTSLARLSPGEQFAYEFDMGDGWEHICTVGSEPVDPAEVYGETPDRPAPYFGWGAIPDQHGRDRDDLDEEPPPRPDPPASDLPPLVYHWGPHAAPPSLAGFRALQDWDGESHTELRGAVARADASTLLALLRDRDPMEVAQLAGDGLLASIDQRIEEAMDVARNMVFHLRGRFHAGDQALADELEAACGLGGPSNLRPVPVDLGELSMHLESGDELLGELRQDLRTGHVWPSDPLGESGEPPPEHWDDPDEWLEIRSIGSRHAWEDMRDFSASLDDGELADVLLEAIEGAGAFRRFRTVLDEHPAARDAWRRYAEERQLGRAREWLAANDCRPSMPHGWT